MKAKRIFNIGLWVLLCVPCLLASCDHDVHSDEEKVACLYRSLGQMKPTKVQK